MDVILLCQFLPLRWLRTIPIWLHPKNSNASHDSTIIDNHFKIIRIHKTFVNLSFPANRIALPCVNCELEIQAFWKNAGRLATPMVLDFLLMHYLPDKLQWSTFSFLITMSVVKKQLFQFTIGSFTWSLHKSSYKNLESTRL